MDFWIQHYQTPCIGEAAPSFCYIAQSGPSIQAADWEYFYDEIKGFDQYEWGYSYHLKVERQSIKNPMEDASSYSYHLKEMVEKKAAIPDSTFNIVLKHTDNEAFIQKNPTDTSNYLLLDQIEVKLSKAEISETLDQLIKQKSTFSGSFKHDIKPNTIILVKVF